MKKALVLISLISILSGCQKSDPYEGSSYEEICEDFDKYAIEQKQLLDQIRAKYHDDRDFITRFNQEQISWIQYQDKRLRALYTKDWDLHYRKEYGKEVFNGCKCKELIKLSKIRNDDLKVYLNGPSAEQLECPIQGTNKKGA